MELVVMKKGVVPISTKEIKIVQMLSEDNTVTGIASKLKLNVRGLEGNMMAIRMKTGCKTIGGIVGLFMREGLVK